MEVSGQLHAPAALPPEKDPPGTHWIGGWVGPRAGLDMVSKRPSPCRESNPDRPAHSQSLFRLSYVGPFGQITWMVISPYEHKTTHIHKKQTSIRETGFEPRSSVPTA
jgi:hypothetical protein